MEIDIGYFVLVVIGVTYFFSVLHFVISEAGQEWWEPFLMPFVMPFIWVREGGLIELRNWCIFLGVPLLLFAALVGIAKLFIFIVA